MKTFVFGNEEDGFSPTQWTTVPILQQFIKEKFTPRQVEVFIGMGDDYMNGIDVIDESLLTDDGFVALLVAAEADLFDSVTGETTRVKRNG